MTTNDTKRTILFPNTKCMKCANCTYIEKGYIGTVDAGLRSASLIRESITELNYERLNNYYERCVF